MPIRPPTRRMAFCFLVLVVMILHSILCHECMISIPGVYATLPNPGLRIRRRYSILLVPQSIVRSPRRSRQAIDITRIRGGEQSTDIKGNETSVTDPTNSTKVVDNATATNALEPTLFRHRLLLALTTTHRTDIFRRASPYVQLIQRFSSHFGPTILTLGALTACAHYHKSVGGVSVVNLYGLSLLGSSCGFYLFLYFITLGFALGVTFPVAISLWVYQRQTTGGLPPLTIVHSLLTILWGIRLFSFLILREYVLWPVLHQKVVQVQEKMNIPFASKLLCWLVYSFFYVALMACCWGRHLQGYRKAVAIVAGGNTGTTVPWGVAGYFGLFLQSTGLVVETLADVQKSIFKARYPLSWCNVGLWKVSTHPNYLGEGIFWLGAYIAHGFSSWLPSLLATIGVIFLSSILKGSARSLASKHKEKYGKNAEYYDFQQTHNVFGPKTHCWGSTQSQSKKQNICGNDDLSPEMSTALPNDAIPMEMTNPL